MSEIKAPSITLKKPDGETPDGEKTYDEKTYHAPAPKTKFWRRCIEIMKKKPSMMTDEGFHENLQFIADVFRSVIHASAKMEMAVA